MKKNMRLVYNLIFMICVLGMSIAGNNLAAYGDEVVPKDEFEDERFYNFVLNSYDFDSNGQLEKSEVELISEMVINTRITLGDNGNIDDLSSFKGLEYFVNLESFYFQGETTEPITDISVFLYLPQLKNLRIGQQWNIADFSVLERLTNLETLDLTNTNCSDVSFLKSMPNLRELYIWDGELVNTDAISGLSNLERLDLANCGLTDISFISGLNKLQHLNLQGNNITDFSVLTNIKASLTYLSIGNYGGINDYALTLENLQFLTEMTNLESLGLIDSGITEIPNLTGLVGLTSISLHHNSLLVDDVITKLPASITSSESWITDSGMDQQDIMQEEETTPGGEQNDVNGTQGNGPGQNVPGGEEPGGEEPAGDELEENEPEENEPEDNLDEEEPEMDEPLEEDELEEDTDEEEQLPKLEDIRADFNIEMEGVFEGGVYVVAKEILDFTDYRKEVTKLLHIYDNVSEIKLYDIAVYDKITNERVQPIGMVKVSIEMEAKKNAEYCVLRLEDDGEWTEVKSEVGDGKIQFYSDHFSIYSVVMTELAERLKLSKDVENANNEKENVKRFDMRVEITIAVIIVVVVLVYDGLRRYVFKK